MYKKLFYVLLFLILFTTTTKAESVINRTLSIGMSGEDVFILQNILNLDTSTQISQTGPGSIGNETSYFGPLMKQAVIKFQEKYASEILTPAGLSKGTGIVGLNTRLKIEKLFFNQNNDVEVVEEEEYSDENTAEESPAPKLKSINSASTVMAGQKIILTGENFSPSYTQSVIFKGTLESQIVSNPEAIDKNNLSVVIPQLSAGEYEVSVMIDFKQSIERIKLNIK